MAKVDTAQLDALKDKLAKAITEEQRREFYGGCCKELAARFLRKAIKRTPVGSGSFEFVGHYKKGPKKGQPKLKKLAQGGVLRRGWTCDTEAEAMAGGGKDATAAAQILNVTKSNDTYSVVVENPVYYASYVEYGHRQKPGRYVPVLGKRLKKHWVPGQYMATTSAKEVETIKDAILMRRLEAYLKGVLGP